MLSDTLQEKHMLDGTFKQCIYATLQNHIMGSKKWHQHLNIIDSKDELGGTEEKHYFGSIRHNFTQLFHTILDHLAIFWSWSRILARFKPFAI